ncbi:MAG: protein kinase, partial [Myxococcales bacterium]|nr:protein kinase [Myxococcales bacterium]
MARTHDPERVLSVVDTEPGLGLVPEDPSDSLAETLLPGESDDYADEDDPTRVGRYMIIEKVGAGGMGAVYAAFDPELDRKVAVKLLHLRHCGSETQLRLIREAQAMARLSHPNVVAVHDVGTYQHRVFMAMDFVEG